MTDAVKDAIAAAKEATEQDTGMAIPEPTVPDVKALKANSQSGTYKQTRRW